MVATKKTAIISIPNYVTMLRPQFFGNVRGYGTSKSHDMTELIATLMYAVNLIALHTCKLQFIEFILVYKRLKAHNGKLCHFYVTPR